MPEPQERVIGRIEGKLDRLIEERTEIKTALGQCGQLLEVLRYKQDNLAEKFAEFQPRLREMEKPLADIARRRERFAGAVAALSFFMASLGSILTLSWHKLAAALKPWL